MHKFGDVTSQPAPKPEKTMPTKRVVSALAVQASAKRGKRLSAVMPNMNPSAVPMVSMEVMNNNFEEWMKLATDNVGAPRLSPSEGEASPVRIHYIRRANELCRKSPQRIHGILH